MDELLIGNEVILAIKLQIRVKGTMVLVNALGEQGSFYYPKLHEESDFFLIRDSMVFRPEDPSNGLFYIFLINLLYLTLMHHYSFYIPLFLLYRSFSLHKSFYS